MTKHEDSHLINPYNFKPFSDEGDVEPLVSEIYLSDWDIKAVALVALVGRIAYEPSLVFKCDYIKHLANKAHTLGELFDKATGQIIRKARAYGGQR
jgi:hypothetical protein